MYIPTPVFCSGKQGIQCLNTLEPNYKILSQTYFSQTLLPAFYNVNVKQGLKQSECVSQIITSDWEMKTFILQTQASLLDIKDDPVSSLSDAMPNLSGVISCENSGLHII